MAYFGSFSWQNKKQPPKWGKFSIFLFILETLDYFIPCYYPKWCEKSDTGSFQLNECWYRPAFSVTPEIQKIRHFFFFSENLEENYHKIAKKGLIIVFEMLLMLTESLVTNKNITWNTSDQVVPSANGKHNNGYSKSGFVKKIPQL